jgi:hypothetical protein
VALAPRQCTDGPAGLKVTAVARKSNAWNRTSNSTWNAYIDGQLVELAKGPVLSFSTYNAMGM